MSPFRGAKAPPAVHFTGFSPRSGPFRWGPVYRLTGQLSGGGRKFFAGSWLKFCGRCISPWTDGTGGGYVCPPESPQRETGRRGGGRREDCCAIRRSFLTHRQVCRERRSRRDRGGATGTVAASRVFTHRTVAAARNRASGFGGDWRVRQQLPVGVGPDDRMPPGSREPKWAQ